jgi:hypothetical protein
MKEAKKIFEGLSLNQSGAPYSNLVATRHPPGMTWQLIVRPRLFYLLDYGFLPQNVREVGLRRGKTPKKLTVARTYKSSPSAITAT